MGILDDIFGSVLPASEDGLDSPNIQAALKRLLDTQGNGITVSTPDRAVPTVQPRPQAGTPYKAPEEAPAETRRQLPVAQTAPPRMSQPEPQGLNFLERAAGIILGNPAQAGDYLPGGAADRQRIAHGQQMQARNATMSWLMSPKGGNYDENTAMVIMSNPQTLQAALMQRIGGGSVGEWKEIGTDENGQKQYGFVNSRTGAVTPHATAKPATSQHDGSSLPPPPGVNPKVWRDTMSKHKAETVAKSQSAHANVVETGRETIKEIDELLAHESFDKAIGTIDGRVPTFLPGATDVDARIKQLRGGAFVQAVAGAKGTGLSPISNAEGTKLEAAKARLEQQGQNEAAYRKALMDYRAVVARQMDIATRASQGNFDPLPEEADRTGPGASNPDPFGLRKKK
jgi:hypothetical protein